MYSYKSSGLHSCKITKTKNSLTGLRYLVNYHRICCVSYLGAQIDENKKSYLLKFMLILWNLAFLSYSSYVSNKEFVERMEEIFTKNLDSTKSIVFSIVVTLGLCTYFIEGFIFNILFMIRGKKILDLMKSQTLEFIADKSEKKIGLFVALIQFLVSFTIHLFFSLLYTDIFIKSFEPFNIKVFVHNLILFFLLLNSQTTIIALIAYQSYTVSNQLSHILNNFSHLKLETIYQFVSKINVFIKKLDQLISIFILSQITINTTICLSFLCMLAIDTKKFSFISISSIVESLTLLISTCLVCDIIPKSFKKFCDKLEESLSEKVCTNQMYYIYRQTLLTKINAIKQDIGFTAFDLFKVNKNTIISCFALILSYSVLLIQTSYEK